MEALPDCLWSGQPDLGPTALTRVCPEAGAGGKSIGRVPYHNPEPLRFGVTSINRPCDMSHRHWLGQARSSRVLSN